MNTASLLRKDGILTGVVKMGQDGQDQTINIESIDVFELSKDEYDYNDFALLIKSDL